MDARSPCRDAFQRPGCDRRWAKRSVPTIIHSAWATKTLPTYGPPRGDGAPRSAKSLWLVPCGTRAPRGAPIATFRQRAPLSLEGRKRLPPRYISQLLAGTPSGPGGSPDAARVPCCARPAGAAPRPAYRDASRERPLDGRGGCSDTRGSEGGGLCGDKLTTVSSSRRKPGSRGNRSQGEPRRALDTGFRRYDGVRFSSATAPHLHETPITESTNSIAKRYWEKARPWPISVLFERHPWPAGRTEINRPNPKGEPS